MQRQILFGAVALVLPTQAWAQEVSVPNCSLQCQGVVARELVRTNGETAAYGQSQAILTQPGQAAPNLVTSTLGAYHDARGRWDGAINATGVLRDFVSLGLAVAGDFEMPFAGVAGAAADIAFERGITFLEGRRDEEVTALLQTGLNDLRRTDEGAFEELARLRPEEAQRRLFGTADAEGLFSRTDIYNNLDPAARAILANAKVDLLSDAVRREQASNVERDRHSAQQIAELGQRLTQYEERFDSFATQTRTALADLTAGQEGLRNAVSALSTQVQGHSYRLTELERVAFGNMSAREQVQALQRGVFPSIVAGLSPQQQAEFRANLDAAARIERAQEFLSDTQAVLGGLRTLSLAFGVENEMAAPLELANKGVIIGNLIVAGMTGNPVAIMSALGSAGGLFGGGRDPVAGQLSAIRREIQELRRDIFAMRREMFEYHRETMQALNQLSQQIDTTYRSLYRQNESTYRLIAFVERGVTELLLDDIERCTEVLATWQGDASYEARRNFLNGFSASALRACRQGINTRLDSGRMRAGGTGGSTIFFLRENPIQVGRTDEYARLIRDAQTFESQTLAPTVSYAQAYALSDHDWSGCGSSPAAIRRNALFLVLTTPVINFGDARAAAREAAAACAAGQTPEYRLFTPVEIFSPTARGDLIDANRVLRDLISANSVLEFGGRAFSLSPMWEFAAFNEMGSPTLQPLHLVRDGRVGDVGAQSATADLRRVRDFANVAISQQNLLSGDLLTGHLQRQLEAGLQRAPGDFPNLPTAAGEQPCSRIGGARSSNEQLQPLLEYRDAICVLDRNAVLRQNFLVEWTRGMLASPERGPITTYALGIDQPDPIYIRQSFRTAPETVWTQCRPGEVTLSWCYRIPAGGLDASAFSELRVVDGYVLLPLPGWEELASYRPARISLQYRDLVGLRLRIEDRLASYAAHERLDEQQRAFMFGGVLASVAPGARENEN